MSTQHSTSSVHHVFVDFENVNTISPELFDGKGVSVTVLLRTDRKTIDTALVDQLLSHAASVRFIRLPGSGKNAVDFALAYYLGQAVLSEPKAPFYLISKDKGYDPLLKHLQQRRIDVHRHDSIKTLPFLPKGQPEPSKPVAAPKPPKPSPAPTAAKSASKPAPAPAPITDPAALSDVLHRFITHLQKNLRSRPARLKSLRSFLISYGGRKFGEATANELIDILKDTHQIEIGEKDAVLYHLPAA